MIVPASPDELTRYVLAAGESPNVDAKGPCAWEADDAAKLCKDIIAMANRRDGGVLVIGKSEPERGCFRFDGLTPQQQATFETTRVAQWVNSRVSQPITIVCHRHEHDGKTFVVITVQEFNDVPIMCTSDCFAAPDRQKKLLRAGDVYVRTENAETSTLQRPEDLRALIGLAVTKSLSHNLCGPQRDVRAGQV
jgi:predicted HTH transcriptional regulator